jgi:hypothetical protein
MAHTAAGTLPENVIEHDGMLWKPERGATTTADEFITARNLFLELNEDSRWNPWVREDRSADISAALEIMDQWQRAEPGHRMLTIDEFEAKMAKRQRERKQRRAERDAERVARKPKYDPERAHARLAVLEHQSVVEHELAEVASFRDGSSFPRMDPQRRQEKIAELDASIEHRRTEIQHLAAVVGDSEEVIGEGGWLPQERRERMLEYYTYERQAEVRKLRKEVSALNTKIEATTDKKECRELKSQLAAITRRLDALLGVPPLTPDDMCSDCPTPIAQHGWVTPPFDGPCPAWPGWAARLRRAREILTAGAREAKAAAPPAPKPEPLAIVPSGLPIAEVTQRLMEIEKKYPDAEVRRGRANRWEVWPKGTG